MVMIDEVKAEEIGDNTFPGLPYVKIEGGPTAADIKLYIDGEEQQGVESFNLEVGVDSIYPTLTVKHAIGKVDIQLKSFEEEIDLGAEEV